MVRVKICCIASVAEAAMAIRHGASAIGLVSEMPSGPGVIGEPAIREIASSVPPAIGIFLLTSRHDASEIIAQQRRCGVNTVQLCDTLTTGSYEELREGVPGVSIVQAVHVTGDAAIEEAGEIASSVDGLLLDSGNPYRSRKELGGTGRTHDWTISRKIRETVDVPVFLAGGLTPENVAEAVRVVAPYGVDVCTGVRTSGKLDSYKLSSFFKSLNST